MAPLKTETEALRVDDALLAGTQIGPVIDQSQLDQDLDCIRIAQHGGSLCWRVVQKVRAMDRLSKEVMQQNSI
ncbi:uncharacterized protein METZ01_LOCUS79184 [marine metagenome]|uniref:Uncharacterized protein n=1 Tax=marine metagenome TaxID=408172 RepID=A0A381UDU9_9ZZZZ